MDILEVIYVCLIIHVKQDSNTLVKKIKNVIFDWPIKEFTLLWSINHLGQALLRLKYFLNLNWRNKC